MNGLNVASCRFARYECSTCLEKLVCVCRVFTDVIYSKGLVIFLVFFFLQMNHQQLIRMKTAAKWRLVERQSCGTLLNKGGIFCDHGNMFSASLKMR